ncbi:NAD-dependent epimerase/dehydratase family protein [Mycobacterium sp. KBS0706]|uniref:NAD-dependent epimerase/dehydratase family protein n=1 Tax=Mycobacterium sp. KBS0706 TaxID=2578109 RepID=UPI00110FB1BA|nr:NAD-dependent epimerase/dehydratase family protein [Mycobacterium sp. KBS0706]TSD84176.1 NAD-dependent epimerase/dehydratase family protein [Mycobacterium sp. KBS0706]
MRILITGSRGLIGTEMMRCLAEAGHRPVPFDIADEPGAPGHGDIRNLDQLRRAMAGCDGVLSLAAVSRVIDGERNPELCWDVNVNGIEAVLRVALEQPADRRPWVVYASSREVYGDPATLPVPEDAPLKPLNIYGRSKAAAEAAVGRAREAGLATAIVRFSNVFGSTADHRDRVVPAFARAAATGGTISIEGAENTFDFTHVEDVGRGLALLAECLKEGHRALPPIHYVGGRAVSLGELAEMARAAALAPVEIRIAPPRNFDVAHFRGDPARAEALLGWRAEIPVEDGLRRLIQAYAADAQQEARPIEVVAEVPQPAIAPATGDAEGRERPVLRRGESAPRRLSALSPWILDFSHDPIRMPPRPPTLRHAGYEDDFDFTTVFCDVFWDASGESIRLVGPPMLNLETELEFRFTALPSMQPCAFQVRHKRWVDLVTVPVPPGTTGLIADTSLGRAFLAPQPNLSEIFAGRRCIYAMSQDNDIAWIQDWVRYYARGHGCNGVVLYDNNSTAYGVREIDDALRSIDPAIEVLTIPWPYKWGVFDGRRPLSYSIWDSFYGQAAAFEHARLRYFPKAASVVNADIDELAVTRDGQSVFEIAEQSDTGFIRFDGWWIHNYTTEGVPQQRRHKHFFHKKVGRLDACTEKWAVVPAKSPEDVQWAIHNVIGMVPDEASFKVGLRHFKPINTSWDVDANLTDAKRTELFHGDGAGLEIDEELRQTLARVFPEGEDERPVEAPARPDEVIAYQHRVRSEALVRGGQIEEAVAEACRAAELLPGHPATLLHLGKLLRLQGGEDEAARLERAAQQLREADPLYHVQLGRSAQHTGAIDEAVASLRTALALDPESIDAAELLFKLFWGHGRFGEGRTLAREWIARASADLAEAQALAATMLMTTSRAPEAVPYWRRALALDPQRSDFHHSLARCLLLDRSLAEAEEAERTAIRLFEEEPDHDRDPVPPELVQKLKRKLLLRASTRSSMWEQLGRILRARGRLDDALTAVREAIRNSRLDPDLHLLLAEILTDLRKPEQAKAEQAKAAAVARELLGHPPNTIRTAFDRERDMVGLYSWVATILQRCGQADEAMATIEEIGRHFAGSANATAARAGFLISAGQAEAAERLIAEAVAKGENNSRLHHLHSTVLAQLGRLSQAIPACRRALVHDPDGPHLHRALAALLISDKRWAEAVAALETAISLDPSHAGAQRQLSTVLVALKRPEEAEAAARRAIELSPDDSVPYRHLANLLAGWKRWKDAVVELRRAIDLDPGHAGAHRQLSAAFAALDQADKAVSTARKAIKLAPDDAALHRHLGNLLAAQKRWDEVVVAQGRAVELEPRHAGARRQLELALAEIRKARPQSMAKRPAERVTGYSGTPAE